MTFLEVAHTLAYSLAAQNYLPASNPKSTRLLIMVYWGTTRAPEHSNQSAEYENLQLHPNDVSLMAAVVAENRVRDEKDESNARLLGYESWWAETQGDFRGTALESQRTALIDELENDRYFVVLMAYDFQLMSLARKHKLLWEARFSMRQKGHELDKDLYSMAKFASRYFGKDSGGLIHEPIPLGEVRIGEIKSLGEIQQPPH
jgi:hypothetical protein